MHLLQAKEWVNTLKNKAERAQKKFITPYIHALVYHVPNMLRKYGNLKQFSCQGQHRYISIQIYLYTL